MPNSRAHMRARALSLLLTQSLSLFLSLSFPLSPSLTHTHIHTYTHTHIQTYTHTRIPTYPHTHIHTYTEDIQVTRADANKVKAQDLYVVERDSSLHRRAAEKGQESANGSVQGHDGDVTLLLQVFVLVFFFVVDVALLLQVV